MENGPLTVTGDGEQRRDFTHVSDIVDGLVKCVGKDFRAEEFELGRGKNYSINQIDDMFGKEYPRENIPEIPQAKIFSEILGLDTLGIIASGSLLICASPKHDSAIIKNLKSNGINATKIGSMKNLDYGLKLSKNECIEDLPRFDTDEIARFFSS